MTLNRKTALALIMLIVCFFIMMQATRERYDERPRIATFLGFTNTGPDQVNAIIRFPSVHPRAPASSFFHKPVYDIIIEVQHYDSTGRGRTRRFGERVGLSAKLPVGEADVLDRVLNDSVSMTLLKAEGVLGFYRDNDLFGWTPPAPKARKWEFKMDGSLIAVTNPPTASGL